MSSLPLAQGARFVAIPDDLRQQLFPATLGLYEWTDYFFHWPGADELEVDRRKVPSLAQGIFKVRWENAIGLASLQPLRAGQPCEPPFQVEVLSPKFPTPQRHITLLSALLNDLFAYSSRMVWSISGATARGAIAARTLPTPLEALDWTARHSQTLAELLTAIPRRPAKGWLNNTHEVPVAQVSTLDANVLTTLATDPQRWIKTSVSPSSGGYLPQTVPQTRRLGTLDVPENRFAVAFVRQLLNSLRAARQSFWWLAIEPTRRSQLDRLQTLLTGFNKAIGEVSSPLPHFTPRDARYRALWNLASTFRGLGQPVFAPAERYARTRDIASLWEFWTFFALVQAIEAALGERPTFEALFDESRGLLAPSKATFASGSLTFNGPAPSYSTPLRPDFLWCRGKQVVAAFDAKFRVEVDTGSGRGTDLHKMHAYRDALGVGAAIALHPGERTDWFDRERGPQGRVPLRAVLEGSANGVGLWGVMPVA